MCPSIEKDFDVSFIADMALREKQVQQEHRPIIAIHKWFARRPGTLFRGLLLSEFSDKPVSESFYRSNSLRGIRVADPFMGGGTPLLEANRVGCEIIGMDINPMAYWIVKQEIEHLDLEEYVRSASSLGEDLRTKIGELYRTRCVLCGSEEADVKYFLWVKVVQCVNCRETIELFPGYLLSADTRHPRNVFVCSTCGQLTEATSRRNPGVCGNCGNELVELGPAHRNRCKCRHCGAENTFPDRALGPPRHRLFAMEYHCHSCKGRHSGRFFKVPDSRDLARVGIAEEKWAGTLSKYVPDDAIPSGDETNRLHRWGYTHYSEMFNSRQLLGLELSARILVNNGDRRIRNALATNLSDLLRYQNMLCRYDPVALKSLDIFSVHGFPVGLIQCESNLIGIKDRKTGKCIGSGGWTNIVEKYRRAKSYCERPFEIRYRGGHKEIVPISGEWIGDRRNGNSGRGNRVVQLSCGDAAVAEITRSSIDAVFTDPPYFANVQYAELIDFCYVWLRKLVGSEPELFKLHSTRNSRELTGNEDMGRDLNHFAEGLSSVFQRMGTALKPGGPLAFTYHHNDLASYHPVAVAILDSGLTCSASLPCPAEMGASIHISGTGSSIIDTVFVCRSKGFTRRKWVVDSVGGVADIVREDFAKLRLANVKLTKGDAKCIVYGHLTRLCIWNLRKGWDKNLEIGMRLSRVASWLQEFGGWSQIEARLTELEDPIRCAPMVREPEKGAEYAAGSPEISF